MELGTTPQQPLSPSGLRSPEPSGTPDMKRLSIHRGSATFGCRHRMFDDANQISYGVEWKDHPSNIICSGNGVMDCFHEGVGSVPVSAEMEDPNEKKQISGIKLDWNPCNEDGDVVLQTSDMNLASPVVFVDQFSDEFRYNEHGLGKGLDPNREDKQTEKIMNEDIFSYSELNSNIRLNNENEELWTDNLHDDPFTGSNVGVHLKEGIIIKDKKHDSVLRKFEVPKILTSSQKDGLTEGDPNLRIANYANEFVCQQSIDKKNKTMNEEIQRRFLVLVRKLMNSDGISSMKVSNSVSLPPGECQRSGTQTILDLQKKVEELKSQLIKEKSKRQAIAQMLSEQRQEADRRLLQKQESWESRLRELQKEKYSLSMRLQKLEVDSPRERILRGEVVQMTKEEVTKLRQEIMEQESLIKGYQIENERAVLRIRETQLEAKEREKKREEEIANLASQLATLQVSARQSITNGTDYASLRESLNLQAELQNAQDRENIVRTQIEKLKKQNKELQSRVSELEKFRIDETDRNQVALKKRDSAIAKGENGFSSNGSVTGGHMEWHNKTETSLESQSTETIQVSTSQDVNTAGRKVAAFESTSDEEIRKYTLEIHKLQQDHDKMKHDYKMQIEKLELEVQIKSQEISSRKVEERTSIKRVRELEKQIEEIRVCNSRKMEELQKKIEHESPEVKAVVKIPQKTTKVKELKREKERVVMLEDIIAHKNASLKKLEQRIEFLENERDIVSRRRNILKKNPSSVIESTRSKNPKASLIKCNDGMDHDRMDNEIQLVANSGSSEVENKKVEGIHTLKINKVERIECVDAFKDLDQWQSDKINKETLCSKNEIQDFEDEWRKKIEVLEKEKRMLEEKLEDMERFKNEQAFSAHLHPRSQIEILMKKVEGMEERQKRRETEWETVLEDTKRIYVLENDMTKRKWELAMEAKNAEIERYRVELDTILEAALKIQQTQLSA